jgi:hypothetical protein
MLLSSCNDWCSTKSCYTCTTKAFVQVKHDYLKDLQLTYNNKFSFWQ